MLPNHGGAGVIVLTLAYAYYRNSSMLAEQFRVWSSYPDDLKAQVQVIVIDDGSPEPAIDVPRPAGLPALTIGRLAEVDDPFTPPWRQDAARNRAADEAAGEWLFLSDMDHVLPTDSLRALLDLCANGPDVVYSSFLRLDAPNLTPKIKNGARHPHPNTYAMSKAQYWHLGGYDERLCGIYGTDGPFRRKVVDQSTIVDLDDVSIVRYSRDVIPDASTRIDRDAFRDSTVAQRRLSESRARGVGPTVLSIPWQRQLRTFALEAA